MLISRYNLYFIIEVAMAPLQKNTALLGQLFFDKKCWQIDELASKLNYAIISVRRLLLQVGYHRSYTHNGRWYTLKNIPVFNVHGLWHHDEIGFSGSSLSLVGKYDIS
jgi:hypothetical protein